MRRSTSWRKQREAPPGRPVGNMTEIDRIAVERMPCPYCTAKRGQKCRTKAGRELSSVHQGRFFETRARHFFFFKGQYHLKEAIS